MKKTNFKKMALMGMAGGMLLASQSPLSADNAGTAGINLAGGCGGKGGCGGYKGGSDNLPGYYHQSNTTNPQSRHSCSSKRGYIADASSEIHDQASNKGKPLTESELLSQLHEQGRAAYQGLTPEGKALALTLANQSCQGKNDCKGLNSCKTKDNASCAGNGSCKGTSPGPFHDKNSAVKVAVKKMAEKRNSASTRPASY